MNSFLSESKNISQYTSETKMSPSSLYSQQVLCSSIPLSKNVHSFFSAFCTEENIEQSISYLDQVTCFGKRSKSIHESYNRKYKGIRKTFVMYKYIVMQWPKTRVTLAEDLVGHL